jgi:hypothetical protein
VYKKVVCLAVVVISGFWGIETVAAQNVYTDDAAEIRVLISDNEAFWYCPYRKVAMGWLEVDAAEMGVKLKQIFRDL